MELKVYHVRKNQFFCFFKETFFTFLYQSIMRLATRCHRMIYLSILFKFPWKKTPLATRNLCMRIMSFNRHNFLSLTLFKVNYQDTRSFVSQFVLQFIAAGLYMSSVLSRGTFVSVKCFPVNDELKGNHFVNNTFLQLLLQEIKIRKLFCTWGGSKIYN